MEICSTNSGNFGCVFIRALRWNAAKLFVGGQGAGSAVISPRLRSYVARLVREERKLSRGVAQNGLPRYCRMMEATETCRRKLPQQLHENGRLCQSAKRGASGNRPPPRKFGASSCPNLGEIACSTYHFPMPVMGSVRGLLRGYARDRHLGDGFKLETRARRSLNLSNIFRRIRRPIAANCLHLVHNSVHTCDSWSATNPRLRSASGD